MRHRGTAAAAALVVVLSAVPAAAAVPAPVAELAVSPSRGVAPATVEVSGSCPAVDDPDGRFFPTETVLTVGGLGDVTVSLDPQGTFTGLGVDLPGTAGPGEVPFATDCGGTASFTVLAAPALELEPDRAAAGAEVVATGTCPRRSRPPDVLLGDRVLVPAPLDVTGEFGPVTFTVPGDVREGRQEVTTSCGGHAILTVLPPVTPPTDPPDPALVVVPDLTGLTEAEAIAVLGEQLVLANPTGDVGRVARQDPPPFARVRAGSPVTIVLEPGLVADGSWSPVVVGGLGLGVLLALLAAAAVVHAVRRRGRERRWLSEHVVVEPAADALQLSDAPRGAVRGLDVDLEVRRLQEVSDGRE
jgi:hypothetical protein